MNKILYVLSNAGDQPGGISVYTEFFCKTAVNAGYTIHFLADGKLSDERLKHYKSLATDSLVYKVISKLESRQKNIKELKAFFKNEGAQYDIIYFNLSSFHYCPALYFATRYTNSKVLVHSHSAGTGFADLKSPIRRLMSLINRSIWANAKITTKLACSEDAGSYLFGKSIDNLVVIHNPVNVVKYQYTSGNRSIIRKEFGLKENEYVVGTVGNLYPIKNHEFMLESFALACKHTANLKYVIIGSGPQKNELARLATNLGIGDKVVFAGQRDDVATCLAGIDCFLFASKREGLGIAGVEAQAAGCYCIFGNKIPNETITSTTTIKLPLKAQEWANRIAECKFIDREKCYLQTYNSSFNYKSVSDNIEKMLLRIS